MSFGFFFFFSRHVSQWPAPLEFRPPGSEWRSPGVPRNAAGGSHWLYPDGVQMLDGLFYHCWSLEERALWPRKEKSLQRRAFPHLWKRAASEKSYQSANRNTHKHDVSHWVQDPEVSLHFLTYITYHRGSLFFKASTSNTKELIKLTKMDCLQSLT